MPPCKNALKSTSFPLKKLKILINSTLDFFSASWIGSRHVQVVMLFLLITLGYGMRVNLSVGIVAMTDPTVNPGMPVSIMNCTLIRSKKT